MFRNIINRLNLNNSRTPLLSQQVMIKPKKYTPQNSLLLNLPKDIKALIISFIEFEYWHNIASTCQEMRDFIYGLNINIFFTNNNTVISSSYKDLLSSKALGKKAMRIQLTIRYEGLLKQNEAINNSSCYKIVSSFPRCSDDTVSPLTICPGVGSSIFFIAFCFWTPLNPFNTSFALSNAFCGYQMTAATSTCSGPASTLAAEYTKALLISTAEFCISFGSGAMVGGFLTLPQAIKSICYEIPLRNNNAQANSLITQRNNADRLNVKITSMTMFRDSNPEEEIDNSQSINLGDKRHHTQIRLDS